VRQSPSVVEDSKQPTIVLEAWNEVIESVAFALTNGGPLNALEAKHKTFVADLAASI